MLTAIDPTGKLTKDNFSSFLVGGKDSHLTTERFNSETKNQDCLACHHMLAENVADDMPVEVAVKRCNYCHLIGEEGAKQMPAVFARWQAAQASATPATAIDLFEYAFDDETEWERELLQKGIMKDMHPNPEHLEEYSEYLEYFESDDDHPKALSFAAWLVDSEAGGKYPTLAAALLDYDFSITFKRPATGKQPAISRKETHNWLVLSRFKLQTAIHDNCEKCHLGVRKLFESTNGGADIFSYYENSEEFKTHNPATVADRQSISADVLAALGKPALVAPLTTENFDDDTHKALMTQKECVVCHDEGTKVAVEEKK